MLLKDFLPDVTLRDLVRCFRIVHFAFDKSDTIPVKVYPPKPENVLHFFIQGRFIVERGIDNLDYQPPVLLVGQRTKVTRQLTDPVFLNFQIVFQPAAIFRMTGLPGSELFDKFINAEHIFGQDIRYIHEQLCAARSYEEMISIAEDFIRHLIRHASMDPHLIDTVASLIAQTNGSISLDWLAKQSCLCTKQFDRKFYQRTGVNPKTYLRITRFNKAFNIKNRYPNMGWLSIADKCGYYDYQHLVRDYKEFTAVTPTAFHLLEARSPEKILGLADELYRLRCKKGDVDL